MEWSSYFINVKEIFKGLCTHDLCQVFFDVISLQQSGGTIVMDADATAALHQRGIAATDDSFKFTWLKVNSMDCYYYYYYHFYFLVFI